MRLESDPEVDHAYFSDAGPSVEMSGLPALAGTHLGYTDWQEMTQERVISFADVTDDHNYIHVNVERAKSSPFGRTVAHGYPTLSLLAPITQQLLRISDAGTMVNYGSIASASRLRCLVGAATAAAPSCSR